MLLTEPFLQQPEETSVRVVWFTEYESRENYVLLYQNSEAERPDRRVLADSVKLSRMRGGKTQADCNDPVIRREIWRHEAVVTELPRFHGRPEEKRYYRAVSDGDSSDRYILQAKAQPGTPMKILLTSDIQNKHLCAANFQKVWETVGTVDAVFVNGDIPHVADRSYDWFDGENAFFRVMQGRSSHVISGTLYHGGSLIQNAPVYASVGNHDVMGRFSTVEPLDAQLENTALPDQFNTTTWEEIFSLPESETGGKRYYAVTIGEVRLIVLEIANAWRTAKVGEKGKYSEMPGEAKEKYGGGQIIFEPITPGSRQLNFLKEELHSDAFRKAKYRMVMFHWQHHSLGMNQVPAYTDPVPEMVKDPVTGLDMRIYRYPKSEDHVAKYVEPLLREAGVNVMFNAHSHLWNRFRTKTGMHIIETSHVGTTDGACYDTIDRMFVPSAWKEDDPRHSLADCWNREDYVLQGDPYGLEPVSPALTALPGNKPYLSCRSATAFSILDTGRGKIDSYYFDTEKPESEVVHFDTFFI